MKHIAKTIALAAVVLTAIMAASPRAADVDRCAIAIDSATGKRLLRSDPAGLSKKAYSPGSAIKAFTVVAAFESGTRTNFTINCGPSDPTTDVYDSCWHRPGHGVVNMEKAIAYSCDRWFIEMASGVDWNKFLSVLRNFGLMDSPIGGAAPNNRERIEAMVGLGGMIRVTPEKLMLAYSAIFNGGYIFIVDADGEFFPARRIRVDRRAVEFLKKGMAAATRYGTASEIGKAFPDATILSKTGTGIFTDGATVDRNRTVAWYVGLYPADSPRATIVVFSPSGTGAHEAVPFAIPALREVRKIAPR